MLEELIEYMKISTMSLATCGRTGQPHNAPVYFVSDENDHLYFFSKPTSQHIQDIEENKLVGVSIYPECFNWEEIHGVQLLGDAMKSAGPQQQKAIFSLYQEKFPFVSRLGVSLLENELYEFIPHWVRIVDNRVRFGYKKEFSMKFTKE